MLREKRQRMYAECDDEAQEGDDMDAQARRVHDLVAAFGQVEPVHTGQAREVATLATWRGLPFSQGTLRQTQLRKNAAAQVQCKAKKRKLCIQSNVAATMAAFNQATKAQRKDKFCIQSNAAAGVAAFNNAEPVYTGQRVALQGKARARFKTRRGPFAQGKSEVGDRGMRLQQWRAKGDKFSIQ